MTTTPMTRGSFRPLCRKAAQALSGNVEFHETRRAITATIFEPIVDGPAKGTMTVHSLATWHDAKGAQ